MAPFLIKYYQKIARVRKDSELVEGRPADSDHDADLLLETTIDDLLNELDEGISDIKEYSKNLLSVLAMKMEISQGVFFLADQKKGNSVLRNISGYANHEPDPETKEYEFGQGFPGQVAQDGKLLNISSVPEGYISIFSGLGTSSPQSLILFPVMDKDKVLAVIELASFKEFSKSDEDVLKGIAPYVAEKIAKYRNKSKD